MATEREADLDHLSGPGYNEKTLDSSPLKDPFVGNVSKRIPLPPDCSGGVTKGHLQFDACFEGGELAAH